MYKKVILTVCFSLLTTFTSTQAAEITPQPSLREKIIRLIKKNPRMFLAGGSLTTLALLLALREKKTPQQLVATPGASNQLSPVVSRPQPRATPKPSAKKPTTHTTNQQPSPVEKIPETVKLSDQHRELTGPSTIPIEKAPEAGVPASTASSLDKPTEQAPRLITPSITAPERPVSPASIPFVRNVDEERLSTLLLTSPEMSATEVSLRPETSATTTVKAPTTSQPEEPQPHTRIEEKIPNKDLLIERPDSVPLLDAKPAFRPATPPLIESREALESAPMPEAIITRPLQGHAWTCTNCGHAGNLERDVDCEQCGWWHCRMPQCTENQPIDGSKEECINCYRIRCHVCSIEVQGPIKESCCTTCGNPFKLASAYPLTLANEALHIMKKKGITHYTSLSEEERTINTDCYCGQCQPPFPAKEYLNTGFKEHYEIIKQYALEPQQTTFLNSAWTCGICGQQNTDKSELRCNNKKCLAWRCNEDCPNANSPFQMMCACQYHDHWQCPACHTITLASDFGGRQGSKRCLTLNAHGNPCNTWANFDPTGSPESKEYWACTQCKHRNTKTQRRCQGLSKDKRQCGREADQTYLEKWLKPTQELTKEAEGFRALFGGYKISFFTQQYIAPTDMRLCSIEEAAKDGEVRQTNGCIILCPVAQIALCQGDGYCGWHGLTGFFWNHRKEVHAALTTTRKTLTPGDIWLNGADMPYVANILNRRVFVVHPCGYTDNGLCFQINAMHGTRYKDHPPIMLIQWPNHYDRIIANNTYEQFTFPDFFPGSVIEPGAIEMRKCQHRQST
ncbi:MAG: hypothetical protein QG632_167 [Candidatus Dependentiae bacterium]|nr:hypothetical protein [Candidatus Dependentiae bacterium]